MKRFLLGIFLVACGRTPATASPHTTAALAPPTGLVASSAGVDALLWPRVGVVDLFVERDGKPFAVDTTELTAIAELADGIEKVASFFEGNNIGQIGADVERFARREPAIFLGAAFAIGLIGGRFLKSSARKASSFEGYDDDHFLSPDDLEDAVPSTQDEYRTRVNTLPGTGRP